MSEELLDLAVIVAKSGSPVTLKSNDPRSVAQIQEIQLVRALQGMRTGYIPLHKKVMTVFTELTPECSADSSAIVERACMQVFGTGSMFDWREGRAGELALMDGVWRINLVCMDY